MKFKNYKIILLILTILIFCGCGVKDEMFKVPEEKAYKVYVDKSKLYPQEIQDSYNRRVVVEEEPQKVISLAPNITEIIFDLGIGQKLVGRTSFCKFPNDSKKIEPIGDMINPSIEKIIELRPDLVVASTPIQESLLNRLEELDIKIVVLLPDQSLQGTYKFIETIGQILNKGAKAKDLSDNMKKEIKRLTRIDKVKIKPKVYYAVSFGETGDYSAGRDTFIADMIRMAGARNVADSVTGWSFSLEKLLEENPDMIICKKRCAENFKNIKRYKNLKAVKDNKVFEIDEDFLEIQGPRLVKGLERLIKIIAQTKK